MHWCKRNWFSVKYYSTFKKQLQLYGNKRTFVTKDSTTQNRWLLKCIGLTVGGVLLYEGIENQFVNVGATTRFLRSLKIAALISYDYMQYFRKHSNFNEEDDEELKRIHLISANRILDGCLSNGGLYIKVGQGVAAINHMLPKEYIIVLSKLYDECLPSDKKDIQKLFKEEFGKYPEDVFDDFNYKPIAAASLAQVFKAKMKSGEDVAVKVQYYDLKKRFPSDIGTIIFLQDVIELFFKNYNFGWILRDIRKNLEQELNFVNEGKNAERCEREMKKLKFVAVPKIYWDVTTSRVLTMEWIDGLKITDKEKIQSEHINIEEVDVKLFQTFSEQIFSTGFVHADPHPGNVLVRKRKNGKVELVLLDHGLYEYIPKEVRIPLCKFWEGTVLRNIDEMKKSANELQITDYENFAEVLFQIPFNTSDFEMKVGLSEEDIKYMQNIAKNHFESVMGTLKEMPRNMLFVVRNLNTIRAISREHGDPINRTKLMARYAQKCLYQDCSITYFRWLAKRIVFEYHFWRNSVKWFVFQLYVNILYKLKVI